MKNTQFVVDFAHGIFDFLAFCCLGHTTSMHGLLAIWNMHHDFCKVKEFGLKSCFAIAS
jgi:hypothetical protein